MIKVVSWQCSGIAWMPWRLSQVLSGSSVVAFDACASHEGLESYGLPPVRVEPDLRAAIAGADVVHLHHAYVADDYLPLIREAAPRAKVVVTLHGEPDRSRARGCAQRVDAYHVVEPGLRALCGDVPASFIPNHPATGPCKSPRREAALFVPFSHVSQHKDADRADAVARRLRAAGWATVQHAQSAHNATVLLELARARACWVQLRGYLDILTMECWQAGAIPIVLRPDERLLHEWADALGFEPALPFTSGDPETIAAAILSGAADATIEHSRRGMEAAWTLERCRDAWDRFYASVA